MTGNELQVETKMKIFSLESKWHLVGWSLVLGFIINNLINLKLLKFISTMPMAVFPAYEKYTTGYPFHITVYARNNNPEILAASSLFNAYGFANLMFWVFIAFIIFLFARHFKYKKF